jgi:hypothetical protein
MFRLCTRRRKKKHPCYPQFGSLVAGEPRLGGEKESTSFLKKRSKKLL